MLRLVSENLGRRVCVLLSEFVSQNAWLQQASWGHLLVLEKDVRGRAQGWAGWKADWMVSVLVRWLVCGKSRVWATPRTSGQREPQAHPAWLGPPGPDGFLDHGVHPVAILLAPSQHPVLRLVL